MSDSEPVILWEDRGAIALVTINRPRALNALNASVMDGLRVALDEKGRRDDLRCIVVTRVSVQARVAS